jgi:predicted Na+-dependent transporter
LPQHVATLGKWVPYLLGIVMLGMGLTITPNDFKMAFKAPRAGIILNCRQTPIITALGALKAILKSLGVIVNPIPKSIFATKSFLVWMLVAAVIGFIFPQHVATLGKWVPYLLGIVNPITAATNIHTKKLFVANILNF